MIWSTGRRAITPSNSIGSPRTSLFKKYFLALFAAVVVPVLAAISVVGPAGSRPKAKETDVGTDD